MWIVREAGIEPRVALCALGPRNWLVGTRTRQDVMRDALANICRTHVFLSTAPVLQHVAQYL